MSFGPASLQTQFAVVAVENATTSVELDMRAPVMYNDQNVQSLTIQLMPFEVFQVISI